MTTQRLPIIFWLLLITMIAVSVYAAPPTQSAPQPVFDVFDDPILSPAEDDAAWDSGGVSAKSVVVVDGVFHMYYDGSPQSTGNTRQPAAIGHATSNDGLVWERAGDTPILTADEVPFTDFEVNAGPVFVEDELWTMYFSTVDDANFSSGVIGRATATDPGGPWEVDPEPIVVNGDNGEWDSRFIFASSLIRMEDEFWLYYTGFGDERGGAIGVAISEDGVSWEKQPDPIIIERGSAGDWDGGEVIQPFVRQTDAGFEMFFMGLNRSFSGASVGYATSEDGLVWTKYEENPVVSNEDGEDWVFLSRPQAVVIDDGTYRLFFTVVHSSNRENAVYLAVGIVRKD